MSASRSFSSRSTTILLSSSSTHISSSCTRYSYNSYRCSVSFSSYRWLLYR